MAHGAAGLLRVDGPACGRRPGELLTKRESGRIRRRRRADRGVPRPDRERRRDHRPPTRERSDRHHVLRLCRWAADRAPARAGASVLPDDPSFTDLAGRGSPGGGGVGVRSIIVADVSRIADSCGYGVPLMSFEGHRPTMDQWSTEKAQKASAATGPRRTPRVSTTSTGSAPTDPAYRSTPTRPASRGGR